ncbi:serine hydrolase [Leptolyngbya sp. AN02str]|uniref:serine hydrolase n=1 Tax=Leptolyngbya sp. AN02str TaxID=3423363 RepID=UPI003D32423C
MFGSGKPSRSSRRRRSSRARTVVPRRPDATSSAEATRGGLVRWEPPTGNPDRSSTGRPNLPANASAKLVRRSDRTVRDPYAPNARLNLRRMVNDRTKEGKSREGGFQERSRETGWGTPLRREPRMPAVGRGESLRRRLSSDAPGSLSRPRPIQTIPVQARPVRSSHPLALASESTSNSHSHKSTKARRTRRKPQAPPSPLLYITRLIILGVGVGAIAGTTLSILNPKSVSHSAAEASVADASTEQSLMGQGGGADALSRLATASMTLRPGQPLSAITPSLQSLVAQATGLNAGVFLMDIDDNSYVDINGSAVLAAASTIKVPVLVAFLQDVDAGKVRLDEMLTMKESDLAEGSGEFQYLAMGSQFTALEVATKMITISDNTATNMIIDRLGGAEALNQRFRGWGLINTVIKNPLADLAGTNTTSAKDLSMLLASVSQGELLSLKSRDRLLEIMRGTVTNSMIPAGVGEEATVAHKTGTISEMVGDTGVVDLPNGKRYVITVLVQRPAGDDRGQELVRQVSRMVYGFFSQPQSLNAPGSALTAPPIDATQPDNTEEIR